MRVATVIAIVTQHIYVTPGHILHIQTYIIVIEQFTLR